LNPVTTAMPSKHEQVRALFDVPANYLHPRRFDIRARVETVQHFTAGMQFERVLDIGCGSGDISLPLLSRAKHLTLLDISRGMLNIAGSKVPADRAADVELINGDFLEADLPSKSFDLICCIGVLAHVDSPAAVIAKVADLIKPNGTIILEFTDSFHFWGVPVVVYQKLLGLLRPEPYALNRLKRRDVMALCAGSGLVPKSIRRYGLPPIGAHKLLTQDQMYRWVRSLFGPPHRNRNAWAGNQFLCMLGKHHQK
jgi:ubiquinone/menaquinone biosynthesis C-methylase UbiE